MQVERFPCRCGAMLAVLLSWAGFRCSVCHRKWSWSKALGDWMPQA